MSEKNTTPCGICSFCIADKIPLEKQNPEVLQKQILTLLENSSYNSKELHNILNCTEDELIDNLKALLDISKIKITDNAKYQLV